MPTKKKAVTKAKKPPAKAKPAKAKPASGDTAAFVKGLEKWQADVVSAVEKLVKQEAPAYAATIKWGHPVYEQNGRPFALVKPSAKHVLFGFWGNKLVLDDPRGLLEGESLRHVKLKAPADVAQPGLVELLRQALVMNKAA